MKLSDTRLESLAETTTFSRYMQCAFHTKIFASGGCRNISKRKYSTKKNTFYETHFHLGRPTIRPNIIKNFWKESYRWIRLTPFIGIRGSNTRWHEMRELTLSSLVLPMADGGYKMRDQTNGKGKLRKKNASIKEAPMWNEKPQDEDEEKILHGT